jgi:cyclase
MNFIRIIPSILISNKKCVKGIKFKNHVLAGSPVTTAIAFDSQQADEILVLDLDAFQKNLSPDFDILKEISQKISTPITFGGNLKNINDIKKSFDSGADKIFLNTMLLKDTKIIEEVAKIYGSQSIMGGINLKKFNNFYKVYSFPNYLEPMSHLKKLEQMGVGEIKITFVDTDGTRKGIDVKYCIEILSQIRIPCIFGGGIGNLSHIKSLVESGIKAISLGSMLYFSDYNIVKVKKFLINEKYQVYLEY